MKVESVIDIIFTEDEVIDAMKMYMASKLHNLTVGSPEYKRREQIITHLNNTTSRIEVEECDFLLRADGAANSEEF